jgi:serine phosphatase RsbU (regulator of sigma subunit)
MAHSKILIADDEPFNVDYLEQELEDTGYEIITAGNGREAFDKVKSDTPDLVLLDIMMPVMDGFEVLTRMKSDPAIRDIPVIVISASSDIKSVVRGIQMGAEDYLPKPFEPTILLARVHSSLEKKRLRDLQKLYLKSLEREFSIAHEIQLGFLPTEIPKIDGWEMAAFFRAAHEVAGDYYDFFVLPDGNLACVIGDVCGKGVGAALFMTLFRSLIRATATSDFSQNRDAVIAKSPAEQLQHIISFTNDYLNETHGDANMFSTIFMGILNPKTNELVYVNCGNESPLILRDGKVVATLTTTGPAVGVIPDVDFKVKDITFEPGDLLLAYTDGVPDALNAEGISFGNRRLAAEINSSDLSPDSLLQVVSTKMNQFIGQAEQFDDITIIAVKRTG